jgi:outer membrane lipoprotein SlyB
MDRHDDAELDRDEIDSTVDDRETHATLGGAAAAGAVTGGVIGLTGGPIGAAIGAVGGAIVGAAAERMMHSADNEAAERKSTSAVPRDEDVTMERRPG